MESQNIVLILFLEFAVLNLLLLPYTAHKTGFRWWAYLIWGILLGLLGYFVSAVGKGISLFAEFGDDKTLVRAWIVFNTTAILFVCLRLAMTKKRFETY